MFCLSLYLAARHRRAWLTPSRAWPRWLRSKAPAIALLGVFFWAYEVWDLWQSPWWTAWIVIGYFLLAFTIDVLFRGASFCKYVCPIGQFQFVQSLVSPWEVRVRDAAVCSTCRTKDCLLGNTTTSGCATELFAPRRLGNMDCTFCLDCVRACPATNVGVLAAVPGQAIFGHASADAADRLLRRPDVAVLVLLLLFAAFANAGAMIAPVLASRIGWPATSTCPCWPWNRAICWQHLWLARSWSSRWSLLPRVVVVMILRRS